MVVVAGIFDKFAAPTRVCANRRPQASIVGGGIYVDAEIAADAEGIVIMGMI